jgi:hypothetical protein
VPVVLFIAAAAILCGVIVVAVGRGGELAPSVPDSRPFDAEIMTAADVALLRPPVAIWGYDIRATDEALNMVARTVTERDVEIVSLRRRIADLESAMRHAPAMPQAPEPASARPPDGQGVPPSSIPQWSAWERAGRAPLPEPGEPGQGG